MTRTTSPGEEQGLNAPTGHYSPVVVGSGLIFISGQLPATTLDRNAGFAAQVRSVLDSLLGVLTSCGGQPEDLLKVTAYIVGVERWGEFNAIYGQVLGMVKPARTVVPLTELHYGWQIEIDAVALHRASVPRVE